MPFLRSSELIRVANSPPWLFAESGTLEKEYGWNYATFLWRWGNCIRECCFCGWIYGEIWYMYGGLACWFWLDNACEKMSTDLLMPEDIANIDWLNSLVDWAIIHLIDESLLPNLAWTENLLEIHWEVFGLDLKHIVIFANAFSYHRLIWE